MVDSWVEQECWQATLGDKRLRTRLMTLVQALATHPTASVPEACGAWVPTKAAYRFWESKQVAPDDILEGHFCATHDRLAGQKIVLAIQDTTLLDFSNHPATAGLGYLEHASKRGFLVHSALAATPEGVPWGLLWQERWVRDPATLGKRETRHERATKDKESQRWITAMQQVEQRAPSACTVVHIADREGDFYDWLVAPRRAGSELLLRARHDRAVEGEGGRLWQTLRAQAVSERITLSVRARPDRPARTAMLTLRFGTVVIEPPSKLSPGSEKRPLTVRAVLVEEEAPPDGVKPLSWLLLTTLPVESEMQAQQVVNWYCRRELIERYHSVLKSGCQIEKLQLGTMDGLERALATYCLVAWHLLWLTEEARRVPEEPCTSVLQTHEWQALEATIRRTAQPSANPPSLRQAVRWIAQLGGFLARAGDGEPGVRTIWRGLRRLTDIAATWQLLHATLPT